MCLSHWQWEGRLKDTPEPSPKQLSVLKWLNYWWNLSSLEHFSVTSLNWHLNRSWQDPLNIGSLSSLSSGRSIWESLLLSFWEFAINASNFFPGLIAFAAAGRILNDWDSYSNSVPHSHRVPQSTRIFVIGLFGFMTWPHSISYSIIITHKDQALLSPFTPNLGAWSSTRPRVFCFSTWHRRFSDFSCALHIIWESMRYLMLNAMERRWERVPRGLQQWWEKTFWRS